MTSNSWDALAVELNVNRRHLLNLRHEPDAPKGREVDEWREFMRARSAASTSVTTEGLPGNCDYDDAVSSGKIDYAKARTREQVIAESIGNETKRMELDIARGKLVTKADAERACASMRDRKDRQFFKAAQLAVSALTDKLSVDQRSELSAALSKAWDDAAANG